MCFRFKVLIKDTLLAEDAFCNCFSFLERIFGNRPFVESFINDETHVRSKITLVFDMTVMQCRQGYMEELVLFVTLDVDFHINLKTTVLTDFAA